MKPWISFDFDNTLIHNPYWRLHLRPWLDQESHYEGVDALALWETIRAEGERLWRKGQWTESFDWPAITHYLGLRALPDPPSLSSSQVVPLIMPGVEAVLLSLRSEFRLAVVSNGFSRFQVPFIRTLGWHYLFDAVIGPDLIGTAKPNPEMLRGISPGLAHIGDRVTHDVLVARRASRQAILFGPMSEESDRIDPLSPARIIPDHHLTRFDQLPRLLLSPKNALMRRILSP